MAKKHEQILDWVHGILSTISRVASAAFTVALFSLLALVLFFFGNLIFKAIWPDPNFVVDDSIVRLVGVAAWPLVVSIALFFVVTAKNLRDGASTIFRRVTNFKAGQYEISFSEAGAKQLKRDIEQSFDELAAQSKIEYMRAAKTRRVRGALKAMLGEICRLTKQLNLPDANGLNESDISATVYMQDVVFEESLVQLVDYVPSGGGGGRRFSIRYGAIGVCYRSENDAFWNTDDPSHTIQSLIEKWGMTSDEANRALQVGFALCLILTGKDGQTAGLLFLYSKHTSSITLEKTTEKQEKVLDEFLQKINDNTDCHEKRQELAQTILAVYEDVAPSGTFINVYK